uniref:Uncharacterized protein n=1 Tax=Kalanchoe fedtschenkoi TaxID=63787 RepID=A0A7N0ZV73_KALFE
MVIRSLHLYKHIDPLLHFITKTQQQIPRSQDQIFLLLYHPLTLRPVKMAMNGGSRMVSGINLSRGLSSGRPIPKRGQVKLAIVAGLAHTLAAAISTLAGRRAGAMSN